MPGESLDMKNVLTLFWVLVAPAAMADSEGPTVLVFGDSLSAGYGIDVDQSWPALLQSRLVEEGYEHRVVNASISGETTEGGATRIATALDTFSPDLVILELGGNDGLRGFPPARIRDNLEKIVQTATDRDVAIVLLGIRIPPNYGPRYTRMFEDVYRELAAAAGVPWIEFFMEGVALNDSLMQDDGIHPNAEAQPILLNNAWPIILEALSGRIGGN